MKTNTTTHTISELDQLCASVRAFVSDGTYKECIEPLCMAMARYPHAPQPHNLLGIVLEKMGDHATAMKHFRAAWALDPTYQPANHNLNTYASFLSGGFCAFDESDVPPPKELKAEHDKYGICRIVRR